jgi:hypothetical protein
LRPFFPFYGSKWSLARRYPAPTEQVVIEPFAGAAGYSTFFEAPRAQLFDADPVVAGVWSYLLRVSPAEVLALPELAEVGDSVDNYALPQEAKWLIGFWLNRGSASPKKSRTAYSARTDRAQLNWSERARQRIASQLAKISGWSITNAPYTSAPDVRATWFVDPPYVDKGRFYRVKFTAHASLGEWCLARHGQVIACEGPGASWLPFTPLGSFKTSKGRADETVYLGNSPSP